MANVALSSNDQRVLSAIFDPESTSRATAAVNSETTQLDLPDLPAYICADLQRQSTHILRSLSTVIDCSPSADQIHTAISALSANIASHSNYAPAYIDRAQVNRLLLSVEALFTAAAAQRTQQILSDLDAGIRLASPHSQDDTVSTLQARTLAAGHTHRGLLLLRLADLKRESIAAVGEAWRDMSADEVDAAAHRDFVLGARYGGTVARDSMVRTNPYAKLCGGIVREVLNKEVEAAEMALKMESVD